jgi:N-formylglutamate amidohydrolase
MAGQPRVEPGRAWFTESVEGDGPLLAVALHHGHDLRPEVAALTALSSEERRREEDPFTGDWTVVAPSRVVVHRSRFEADLNRPREAAVYRRPEDAWGLHFWKGEPPADLVERSRAGYDAFYRRMEEIVAALVKRWGRICVLDLHTYNHRRGGPQTPPAPPEGNPEVNLGTGTLDRGRWGAVADAFLGAVRGHDYLGRTLDARENVKFKGGHFSRWVHERFPDTACSLAIEMKKIFMDEWTGEPDAVQLVEMERVLAAAASAVVEALERA